MNHLSAQQGFSMWIEWSWMWQNTILVTIYDSDRRTCVLHTATNTMLDAISDSWTNDSHEQILFNESVMKIYQSTLSSLVSKWFESDSVSEFTTDFSVFTFLRLISTSSLFLGLLVVAKCIDVVSGIVPKPTLWCVDFLSAAFTAAVFFESRDRVCHLWIRDWLEIFNCVRKSTCCARGSSVKLASAFVIKSLRRGGTPRLRERL